MKIEVLSSGRIAPSLSSPHPHPVALLGANAPELQKWTKEPRLRRASAISSYMMEAVHQALEAAPGIDCSRVGVIASFFLGCMVYTVRFYKQITEDGRRYASPILFPETVFNTPVSHLVATLGLGGPVYTQVGDKSCWATALRTAECWLRLGSADHVLVLGAEEFDPQVLEAMRSTGLYSEGMVIGEGAGALLLTSQVNGRRVQLAGVADGYGFANKAQAHDAARNSLAQFPDNPPILSTATSWTRSVEASVTKGRLLPGTDERTCEAFTARAAWDTLDGIELLKEKNLKRLIIPYWGLTQQFGSACFAQPEA
jgi:3-oxoacyl-(acyl-carrier-protein) synthase